MSPELLLDEPLPHREAKSPHHIHDMESVFWLLCWLSLKRDGPGRPRKELNDGTAPKELCKVVDDLFEANPRHTAGHKVFVLAWSNVFEKRILSNSAPYFVPLTPLIRELREHLYIAYYRDDEASKTMQVEIHDKFIDSLHRAWDRLKGLSPTDNDPTEEVKKMVKEEEDRRKGDIVKPSLPETPQKPSRISNMQMTPSPIQDRKRQRVMPRVATEEEEEALNLPTTDWVATDGENGENTDPVVTEEGGMDADESYDVFSAGR
jgi:hypothetical protein